MNMGAEKQKKNYTWPCDTNMFIFTYMFTYFAFSCVKISLHYLSIYHKKEDSPEAFCVASFSIG